MAILMSAYLLRKKEAVSCTHGPRMFFYVFSFALAVGLVLCAQRSRRKNWHILEFETMNKLK